MTITARYTLFPTDNNAIVMNGISQDQRGVVFGMLNFARNLGLVTGSRPRVS